MRASRLFVLLGVMACGGTPAAEVVMGGAESQPVRVDESDPVLRRQLGGHLRRVEGCFAGFGTTSALVEVAFEIEPDGHVREVVVGRDTSTEPGLGPCIRSRLARLYFDPAPDRVVSLTHRFARCEESEGGVCMLGPAERVDSAPPRHQRAVEALFAANGRAISACQAGVGAGTAQLVEVELTLGTDGRVMSGRITDAVPAGGPSARCALRPLLGSRVDGEAPSEPARYRRTLMLRPAPLPATAALAP